jgi:hypothetical protein
MDIMKKLPEFLPVKKQHEIEGQLTIPAKHIGACGGVIRAFCTVSTESYRGSDCVMSVSIGPSDYNNLMAELQRVTKGEFSLEVEGSGAQEDEDAAASSKSKKKGKATGGAARGGGGGKRGARGGSDATTTTTSTSTSGTRGGKRS